MDKRDRIVLNKILNETNIISELKGEPYDKEARC